jgi:hypothetical protein
LLAGLRKGAATFWAGYVGSNSDKTRVGEGVTKLEPHFIAQVSKARVVASTRDNRSAKGFIAEKGEYTGFPNAGAATGDHDASHAEEKAR